MDSRNDPTALLARILAIVSLFVGLGDAAAVLGIGAAASGQASTAGFIFLTALSVTRLFAAVGLWIGMQWGALVLLASLVIEIALYLSGSDWVRLSLWGFIFKLAILLATIGIFGFAQVLGRRHAAD